MKKLSKKLIALTICGALLVPTGAMAAEPQSHLEKVLEMDSTYEGFMSNEEVLSFE